MKTLLALYLAIPLLIALLFASGCQDDIEIITPKPDPESSVLDTTSHDFVWEFDTVAVQFSSITSVAALSPTDIWVTGKFFKHDSLGNPDPKPIGNVAHWNGSEWTYHGFNSSGYESWYEMDDAFATSADNLWVCGGSPFQWDGAKWKTHGYDGFTFGGGIAETWATADAKYACVVSVDKSCAYYRYDDPAFRKVLIPSEAEDCLDVVGLEDGTMFVGAGARNSPEGHIYRITPDRKAEVYHDCSGKDPFAIWFQNGDLHYGSGHNIFRIDRNNHKYARPVLEASDHIIEEDHDEENNVVVMMQANEFLHFNGATWMQISIPYPASLHMRDVDVSGKEVYFVAFSPDQYCIVVRGRRL
ncbi:MAG: hypothetical protein WBQ23_11710 [Bacteroidota bacterium]